MKQFYLEEFKNNQQRKVVTRSGRPVRILCTDAKGDCPVFGLALDVDGSEFPIMCAANGESEFEEEDDLFFDTVTNEGWVNIYKLNEHYMRAGDLVFPTKEEAMKSISSEDYVTTVHIEFEEE